MEVYYLLCICRGCNFINNKNNSKNNLAVNNEIREPQVRLVAEDGEPLGVMSGRDAQGIADKANLDLVMIAPQGKPPVCKIMDYGKYRFDQSKREKDQRKHQQQAELKEVRLSLNIDDHDFTTKANHAKKFLKAGSKVKVTIRFKGREVTHFDLGRKLMDKFKQECSEFGISDGKPSKLEGKFYTVILSPLLPKSEKSTIPAKQHKNKDDNVNMKKEGISKNEE